MESNALLKSTATNAAAASPLSRDALQSWVIFKSAVQRQ